MPEHTPTESASHKCCPCGGCLHEICGVDVPPGNSEPKRTCRVGLGSNANKRRRLDGGAASPISSESSNTRENAMTKKNTGAEGLWDKTATTTTAVSQSPNTGNRVRLDFHQKNEVLDLLKMKMTVAAVSRKMGIGESTVRKIRMREKIIREKATTTKGDAKSLRGAKHPEIEERVLEYIVEARRVGLPVTRDNVRAFGHRSRAVSIKEAQSTSEREHLEHFQVSEGWVKKFIARHRLKSKVLHGKAGSVNSDDIANAMTLVHEACDRNDPDCTVNVDKTSLFCKVLPRRTYIAPSENRKIVQALHNDMVNDLLGESTEQAGKVIDSDNDTLDIDGGERTVPSTSSGSRPFPPFSTVIDKFMDLEELAMQSNEQDVAYHLGKAKLAWFRANASRNGRQTDVRSS